MSRYDLSVIPDASSSPRALKAWWSDKLEEEIRNGVPEESRLKPPQFAESQHTNIMFDPSTPSWSQYSAAETQAAAQQAAADQAAASTTTSIAPS